jgi:hypothetical protein
VTHLEGAKENTMKAGKGIAGMRRIFSHRYTRYSTTAFNALNGLIEQGFVRRFTFDEITSYGGCVRCNKETRAVTFISHVCKTAVTIFMRKNEPEMVKEDWRIYFAEVKIWNEERYYELKTFPGEGVGFHLVTFEAAQKRIEE